MIAAIELRGLLTVDFGLSSFVQDRITKMKPTNLLVLSLAVLIAGGYGILTTSRIRHLEGKPLQSLALGVPTRATYGFDDSFIRHFGARGVAVVQEAFRSSITDPDLIMIQMNRKAPGLRYELP